MAGKNRASNRARWEMYSQLLIGSSVVAVFFAGIGYLGTDIWLASTQWLLASAVLAALGVYAKLESK